MKNRAFNISLIFFKEVHFVLLYYVIMEKIVVFLGKIGRKSILGK